MNSYLSVSDTPCLHDLTQSRRLTRPYNHMASVDGLRHVNGACQQTVINGRGLNADADT